MASVIAPTAQTTQTTHIVIRQVQPGSWQPCFYCFETIEYVPGGDRTQATAKIYDAGELVRVEHSHSECQRINELFESF